MGRPPRRRRRAHPLLRRRAHRRHWRLSTPTQTPTAGSVVLWDDFDPGRETWTHTAALGTDDWQVATTAYAHSPSHAYYASDPNAVKDDRLQTRSLSCHPMGS